MARLVRFYGGMPMQWLEDTPIEVLQGMAAQIPVLQADEALAGINAALISNGQGMKARDSRAAIRRLERRAGITHAPQRGMNPGKLAAMGIAVRHVDPTSGKPPGGDG